MYSHIAVGGTFDHFHKGHEHLLKTAFISAKQVTIGLIADNLLEHKKFNQHIEPFDIRKKNILQFLHANKLPATVNIVKIHDIFGPASSDKTMDSIIATKENIKNVRLINKKRAQDGLTKLKVITVNFIKSNDKKIIRSSRIRKGEINKQGTNYLYLFTNKSLVLPEHVKEKLRKPFGVIIEGTDKNINKTAKKAIKNINENNYEMIISVGDVVTASLIEEKLIPDISIIDNKTQRKTYIHSKKVKTSSFSKNIAGKIQKKAVYELNKKIKKYLQTKEPSTLLIQGEEDLLALPSMLLAPLHSLVIYGQSGLGMILVEITIQLKEKVEKTLSEFI